MKLTHLLKEAGREWSNDNVSTLSGSLAYATVFSIAPLLIIAIGIAGYFFGTQGSTGAIYNSLQSLLGADGANAVESLVTAASQRPNSGLAASLIGLATLLLGASSAFQQLQQALNIIWKVRPAPRSGWGHLLRQRFLSFSMVLVIAFLLLVSLVVSAALSGVGVFLRDELPGGALLWQTVNVGISLGVISCLFSALFKVLPDVKLRWRDVAPGALATALLFTLGKMAIGLYLGHSGLASAYGAFGSLIVVLVWVYYSSAILFFGAELTRVLARARGHRPEPADGAEWIMESGESGDSGKKDLSVRRAA